MKLRLSESGLHVFDRVTGVNFLFDEVAVSKTKYSEAPRNVAFALTNACDLSCSHCYAPKLKASLDLISSKRWLKELDDYGCLGVGFGGGEPTLYPEFVELCGYAQTETKLAVTVTTHGHHLTGEFGERVLPAYFCQP